MVPLPPFIYNNLSGQLQLISSELGVAVIRLFGISVFLEGNVIDLGTYQLQVVEACSGLRYLFPLVSLSFVAAYLYKVETWKRVIVFLSSIPITVLMNSFRIGVIGVLVEYFGIEQAEGFLHDFEGWIIFMACMGILFIEMAILARVGKRKYTLSEVFGIEIPDSVDEDCEKKAQNIGVTHYVLLAVLALYSVSTLYIQVREDLVLARKDFSSFPLTINDWTGNKTFLEKNILDSLKADDYIVADYRSNEKGQVNYYVAYYASQQAGSAAHSPRACIPGGGWKINDLQTVDIDDVTIMGEPLSVNRMLIKKGDYGQLVYYWFQQRDRVVTNEYMVKWYLFWDALTRNRTDGSLIRFTTSLSPGEDLNKADARLISFLKDVEPVMMDYMPE
jgi:exosortase D (VPLPA-CTERM-specific)